MVRRKNQEKSQLDNELLNLKNRIDERKQRLAKTNQMQGLTKEQQEKLINNYFEQLKVLDSAYNGEQRRQHLFMWQQKEMRRRRAEKYAQINERIEAEKLKNDAGMGIQGIKSNVMRNVLQRKGTIVLKGGP